MKNIAGIYLQGTVKLRYDEVMRYALAIILGIVVGAAVNMGLVILSPYVIPFPDGIDVTDVESIKENLHLFEGKHFIFPFFAHALGTFAGALVAALITKKYKRRFAFAIGVFFLIGGAINILMIAHPAWFAAIDLILAYLPMAWIATKLSSQSSN